MAQDSVTVQVKGDPQKVWALVEDFGGIAGWFPGIESCRVENDVRIIDMGGMEVREQLIELDQDNRALTYSVVSGVPIESHRATVSVAPTDEGSEVTWTFAVEPDEMIALFSDVYGKALESLASHVE